MLSSCYCVILKSAARRVGAFYDQALAPLGINTAQLSLLRVIAPRQPIILTELGRLMELDRSTVGRNVRVLERIGLLQLGRGKDQREAAVTLSEAGRRVLDEAAPLWEAAQLAFEERMGAQTLRELSAALNRI